MSFKKRKKTANRAVKISIFTAIAILIVGFSLGLYLLNDNYCKIYDSPEVSDGKVDFDGVSLLPRDVACNLSGKWEFFYGRWIVTDGYDGECDGLIDVPSLWTYKDFGNGTLKKEGYASYRLVAENVQEGADVVVFRHNENFAYRVYINGELNYVSGTLSKDPSKTVATGVPSEIYPYKSDGSPLVIVIELSATEYGGLNAAPWLAAAEGGVSYGEDLRAFTYVALGVTLAAVVLSILSAIFFAKKKDVYAPLLILFLFCHFLVGKDMAYVTDLSYTTSSLLRLFTAAGAYVMFVLRLFTDENVQMKKHFIISSAFLILSVALIIAFYGTPIAPIFALLFVLNACSFIYPFCFKTQKSVVEKCIYGVMFSLIINTLIFEFCDGLGVIKFGTEFIFSLILMIIIICFTVLWLYKIALTEREAIKVSALEKDLALAEFAVLKAQIKPHFVYNSLTAIQHEYRKDLNKGDSAVEKFARHLRLITDNNGVDLIDFEEEIKNVLNYFELENLRHDGKLSLFLNLEYTDFKVPPLSIEPLIENAVRHAKLVQKQDGYAEITSCLSQDKRQIIVTVSDNGCGFDTKNTKIGVGLCNTKKRFELINANFTVESNIGDGTKITITILR